MTLEEMSVARFEEAMLHAVRPKGTNAAVTLVMIAAIRAAAAAAPRTLTGAIDEAIARKILQEAVQGMGSWASK